MNVPSCDTTVKTTSVMMHYNMTKTNNATATNKDGRANNYDMMTSDEASHDAPTCINTFPINAKLMPTYALTNDGNRTGTAQTDNNNNASITTQMMPPPMMPRLLMSSQ
mmetsp:Transcript_31628/g.38703  ORF Transcript_31628/g.38703 Transcript_31628/m.38703 type:complete len:109 (+) Transcript_31628:727-1053(+)